MSSEWEAGSLLELLGDELARRILALTSVEALSADELSHRCDISQPTVYRRLKALAAQNLVEQRAAYDDDGNHFKTYVCQLETVCVGVDDGSFTVDLRLRHDVLDGNE